MMLALQVVNTVLLVFILLCALDVCRITHTRDSRWCAFANCALALGAAGSLAWYHPASVNAALFQLVQDAGIAVLCLFHLRRELQRTNIREAFRGWRHVQHH